MAGYEFLYNKEANREKLDLYLHENFWEKSRDALFSDDIVVDLPSAPPGMPQHLDAFDYRQYRSWLERTVTHAESRVRETFGTPDPNVFWAVRDVKAQVNWGKQAGTFESRVICRVEFRHGKIRYIKNCWNPLQFLYAAGVEVPLFKMDLYDPRVDQYLKEHAPAAGGADVREELDESPAAVAKRTLDNLEALCRPDYWDAENTMTSYSPDCESVVWFLPPEMKESYPPELMDRVNAWSELSCPNIDFDEDGRYWATDDPHVYFCEYMCSGLVDWIGNNAPGGHYRNRYFYILRFDDLGRVKRSEEILNPINKFNSIGVSLPTFPYYFR